MRQIGVFDFDERNKNVIKIEEIHWARENVRVFSYNYDMCFQLVMKMLKSDELNLDTE